MEAFLKQFGGNRDGCFLDGSVGRVDAAVVCHEVRNVDLARGETVWISCHVSGERQHEQYAALGEVLHLRALPLGATVALRAWALVGEQLPGRYAEQRACGEVRVPLRQLATRYGACLYHTWLLLESLGLTDSVASFASCSDSDTFDAALLNGPRQLFQPKVCLSVVRATDMPASGKMIWNDEVPAARRSDLWGSLLRSQQQHALMCQALFSHGNARGGSGAFGILDGCPGPGLNDSRRRGAPVDTVAACGAARIVGELEAVRGEVAARGAEAAKEIAELQAHIRTLEARRSSSALAKLATVDVLTASPQAPQVELVKLQEACAQASAAEQGREEAVRQRDQLSVENRRLTQILQERTRAEALNQTQREQHRQQSDPKEVERLQAEKLRLVEEHARAEDRTRDLEHLVHERALEIAKSKGQLRSVEASLRLQGAREHDATDAAKRLESAHARIQRLQEEHSRSAADTEKWASERARLVAKFEAAASQGVELDRMRAARDTQRLELASLREAAARQLSRAEIAGVRGELDVTVSGRDEQGAELDCLRAASEAQTFELASLREGELRQRTHLTKLRLELDTTLSGRDAQGLELEELRSTCESQRLELTSFRDAASRQHADLSSLRLELDTTMSGRDAQVGELERLRATCESQRLELVSLLEADSRQRGDLASLRLDLDMTASGREAQSAELERSRAMDEAQRLELRDLREGEARQRNELKKLQRELDAICEEGSTRMGAASGQVRALREAHEGALREVERLGAESSQWRERTAGLEAEVETLREQKGALAQIVEDLHQSCVSSGLAGLSPAERLSIDGITRKNERF